jgi:hypothetical protein
MIMTVQAHDKLMSLIEGRKRWAFQFTLCTAGVARATGPPAIE